MAKGIGAEEHKGCEHQHEHGDREAILHRVVRVEGNRVRLGLHLHAGRVIVPGHVQGPDVQDDHTGDHERHQVVQGEEAVQGRVIDCEAAPQPCGDGLADQWQGTEQVGDHHGAVEAHLAPGQDVAHEGRGHHQQVYHAAQDPEELAGRLVGAVIEATEHVGVDGDEEHRGPVGVHVAYQPAVVHVPHDPLDRGEGIVHVGHVVHGQDDAGDQLDAQAERQDPAKGIPVVQVLRGREIDQAIVG